MDEGDVAQDSPTYGMLKTNRIVCRPAVRYPDDAHQDCATKHDQIGIACLASG